MQKYAGFTISEIADKYQTFRKGILCDQLREQVYREIKKATLDILFQGVDAWNKWRQDFPFIKPFLDYSNLVGFSLTNANLMGAYLMEANLIGVNLSNANLMGAYLMEANLIGANLSNANLTKAKLDRADLSGAKLTKAIMVDSSARGIKSINATLSEAMLTGSYLVKSNFVEAKLNPADLSNTNLDMAIFTRANLRGTNFQKANMGDIILTEADLRDAKIKDAYLFGLWDLQEPILTRAIYNNSTEWPIRFDLHTPDEEPQRFNPQTVGAILVE